MKLRFCAAVCISMAAMLLMPGCKKKKSQETILTVWDYYGKEVSPLSPVIAAFEKENPGIKVKREDLDWETIHTKLNVVLSTNNVPDLVTIDMTWLPTYASLGVFSDLNEISKGMLNGKPFKDAWSSKAVDSMTHEGKIVAALFDFDAYALYYRSDIFAEKKLKAPANWSELIQVGKAIATKDKNLYALKEDTFHAAQFIYENGAALLTPDHKDVAFTSAESIDAIQFCADMITKHKIAINWTPDQGEITQGVKDGRIAMFADGPYYMAQLRQSVPEQSGKWAIAPHPISRKAGSYLGGTGLCIPAKSTRKDAAWKFAEFLMRPENAALVYTRAGAAPALLDALDRPEVNAPDPYFGGQVPMTVFRSALASATAFPDIRQWGDVDVAFAEGLRRILSGRSPVKESLEETAKAVRKSLKE